VKARNDNIVNAYITNYEATVEFSTGLEDLFCESIDNCFEFKLTPLILNPPFFLDFFDDFSFK
jgi:hypothetical protein